MSSDPRTEKLLRDFLEADAESRAKGVTLEALYGVIRKVVDDQSKERERADRTVRRVQKLEHEVQRLSVFADGPDWRPDPRDITGSHDARDMQRFIADARDDEKWRRRKMWEWAVSAVGAIALAVISGCGAYALAKMGK